MSNIKAICFDLDGVYFTPQGKKSFHLALSEEFGADSEKVDEDVQKAVQSAKKQGYITCVCTNNNAARLPILKSRFNLDSEFDIIVSSHEVGFTKPSKEIFQSLLAKIDVQPNELVYSDDNPDRLQGAKRGLAIVTESQSLRLRYAEVNPSLDLRRRDFLIIA
jgi:HAD superfamily hydrolase (TIGR01509 family)